MSKEKFWQFKNAATSPSRDTAIVYLSNTSNSISSISIYTSSGTWGAGSEIIVIGND